MSKIRLLRRKFPWINDEFTSLLDTNDFFVDDFFLKGGNIPPMNIKETKDSFELEFSVPGFSKDEIEVVVENNYLNVCAKKSEEFEEEEEGYSRQEFNYREFERRFKLPNYVNTDEKVKAHYSHGILKLTLPLKVEAKEKPKKVIEIS